MVEKDVTRTIPAPWYSGWAPAAERSATPRPATSEGRSRSAVRARAATSSPGPPLAARRVDGDGNGLVADAQDRLWIDLNGDGRFDPSAEQFLFATVLNLDGSRYVVRSDELGTRLAIEPLIGVGTLRLAWKGNGRREPAEAVEMHATALGRDGSVFGLSGTEPATVPVGEYRLGTVTDRARRSQGRPALVVRLLRQRRQGRAPVVQGREGRHGHDRPDRHAELRDQSRATTRRSVPGPART